MDMPACQGCGEVFPRAQCESIGRQSDVYRSGVNSLECNNALGQLLYEYEQGCFNQHSPQAYAVQYPAVGSTKKLGIDRLDR